MADINAFVVAGTAEKEQSIVMNTTIGLQHKQIRLTEIVVSISDYMNGDDRVRLAKALEFLSQVLIQVDMTILSRQDVNLMVTFFSTRIETPSAPGIKESAIGLRALVGMKGFMKNNAPTISKRLFAMAPQFNMNPASTRLEVYKVLDALMTVSRSTLIDIDCGFIKGFLELSALEKDPRCLMVVFSMIPVLVNEWAITNETSDLWEATSRYFPITFNLPLNEQFGVTPEDLKLRLRGCMACTSSFADLAFPYLLNKLDEFAKASTKRDVMQTMIACINNYHLNVVSTWSLKIWDAVKFEVLNAVDDGLAEDALTTIGAITARLNCDQGSLKLLAGTPLFRFVIPVANECVDQFRIPMKPHTKQAAQIIGKICIASTFAFYLVVVNCLAKLIIMHRSTDVIQIHQELLDVFNEIADAGVYHSATQANLEYPFLPIPLGEKDPYNDESVYHGGLSNFCAQLFDIYFSAIRFTSREESAIRTTAVKGLLKLVKIPIFLADNHILIAISQITDQVLLKDSKGQLKEEAVAALYQIAKICPDEVLEIAGPKFLDTFPDFTATEEQMMETSAPLIALAEISQDVQLFERFWIELIQKLKDLYIPDVRPEVRMTYSNIILAALLHGVHKRETDPQRILTPRDIESTQNMIKRFCRFFCRITEDERALEHKSRQQEYVSLKGLEVGRLGERRVEYPDDSTISLLGRITVAALRGIAIENQQFAAAEAFTLFAEIGGSLNKAIIVQKQVDLMIHGAHFQKRTLPLTAYILAGLRREIRLNFNPEVVCSLIIRTFMGYEQNTEVAHNSLLGIMALLYNKWCPDVSTPSCDVTRLPVDLIKDIISNLASVNSDVPEALARVVDAIMIFIKVANLKGDRQTRSLLGMLMDQLGHDTVGPVVASGFSMILAPSEILKKENHLVVRPLYQQRPFAICLPRILELSKTTVDSKAKTPYLVALSGLLKWTPLEVVIPEIDAILPLLLQELKVPGSDTKIPTLNAVELAIVKSPASVEGHLRSIINRLQDPIHFIKDDPTTSSYWRSEVRTKALTCLSVIPDHIKEAVIIPYKFEVLRGLELAINDDKRHVRDEAVRCRSVWFNLAEPIEDEE